MLAGEAPSGSVKPEEKLPGEKVRGMSSVPETPIAAKVGGKLTVKADEVVEVNGNANEKFAWMP